MSQTTDAGPFGAFENPFANTQIPDTGATFNPPQSNGFEMPPPQAPNTGAVQTQGSPGPMDQQVMGSEMSNGPFGNMPTQQPFNNPVPQAAPQPTPQAGPFNMPQAQGANFNPNPFNNIGTPANNAAAPQNGPFNNNGNMNGNNNQKMKYHIFDFGYLINRRIYINGNLEGEAPLVSIGYNASFGNMRINFKGTNEINAQSNYFTITKLTSGGPTMNIYPPIAEQILSSPPNTNVFLIDQVITPGNWTPTPSAVCILQDGSYLLYAKDNNNQEYKFTIMDFQINFFKHCLEFMINGGAWNLLGLSRFFS